MKKPRMFLKHEVESILDASVTIPDLEERAGVRWETFKNYCKMYDIPYAGRLRRKPYVKALVNASSHRRIIHKVNTYLTKPLKTLSILNMVRQLMKSGMKPACCEKCGYNSVRPGDGHGPYHLIFKNKDLLDASLDNLMISCYNCYYLYKGFRNVPFDHTPTILVERGLQVEKKNDHELQVVDPIDALSDISGFNIDIDSIRAEVLHELTHTDDA